MKYLPLILLLAGCAQPGSSGGGTATIQAGDVTRVVCGNTIITHNGVGYKDSVTSANQLVDNWLYINNYAPNSCQYTLNYGVPSQVGGVSP